ncbi:MAG TPA: DUF5134 domain-containing protein [Jatrophihabitans sp.]
MASTMWLRWALAAVMAATAGYHIVRLVAFGLRRHRLEIDVDLSHAAMGATMAAMLLGSLSPGDSRRWAIAFLVPTLWFAWLSMIRYAHVGDRDADDGGGVSFGDPARQVLACAAMLYMLLVGGASTAGMSGATMAAMHVAGAGHLSIATSPALGALLLVAMVGVTAQSYRTCLGYLGYLGMSRIRRPASPRDPAAAPGAMAPSLTAGCRLAMNVTTVYMLVHLL